MSKKRVKVGDKEGVKARDKDVENVEVSLDMAIRDVMGTIPGRQVLWWILKSAKVGQQPAALIDGELGRRLTDFHCGELNVGNRTMARIMKVCPELYIQGMREAKDDDE